MTRWEYLTIKFEPSGWTGGKIDSLGLRDELNRRGEEGWEVTGVIEAMCSSGKTRDVVILLKRPKL